MLAPQQQMFVFEHDFEVKICFFGERIWFFSLMINEFEVEGIQVLCILVDVKALKSCVCYTIMRIWFRGFSK